MRHIPIALIPREKSHKTLQGIYLEQHQNFDILWYHWPQDGFFPVEDYEPIILIYNDKNEICCVCVRRGWEYKPATIDELDYPIMIGFEGTFHHPYLCYKDQQDFEKRFSDHIQTKLQPTVIKSDKIPPIARTGQKHPTLVRRDGFRVKDPIKKAQEIRLQYCMNNI